jgi:hypothetical protein
MKITPPLSFVLFAALCLAGCASHGPGSSSHASAQIPNATLAAIQDVSAVVFIEKGYTVRLKQPDMMVFDRPGSRNDALKWGGWDGSGVTMRVKMAIRDMGTGTSFLLQADAYAVRDASDPFFASENRNMMLNHRPYQKLLNEVQKRLKTKT